MNKLPYLIAICCICALTLVACQSTQNATETTLANTNNYKNWDNFGSSVTQANKAIPVKDAIATMHNKQLNEYKTTITGTINSVCKVKGCWMELDNPAGESVRITFKDYGFFVPLDASGKQAIVQGTAKIDTTSVELLRHYAEDAGLPQAEIEKITQPEIGINMVADGVLIK